MNPSRLAGRWIAPMAALALHVATAGAGVDPPVVVALDLDLDRPGRQSEIRIAPGTEVVSRIGVFVFDPLGTRQVWSIGYAGGLDRGIAIGHMTSDANQGNLVAMIGRAGRPANPQNTGYLTDAVQPGFEGPELHYIEPPSADRPALLPSQPDQPLFEIEVTLRNARAGDRYALYLLDMVSVWRGGQSGAFSVAESWSLDTGGDSIPDGTWTIHGSDPDVPLQAPPAAYLVDYIDGGDNEPGGAIIRVACPGDYDGDGQTNGQDFLAFLSDFFALDPRADLSGDGAIDGADFLLFLSRFFTPC